MSWWPHKGEALFATLELSTCIAQGAALTRSVGKPTLLSTAFTSVTASRVNVRGDTRKELAVRVADTAVCDVGGV
jgi:hypothetical protein